MPIPRMRGALGALAAVLVVGLVITACGDDDKDAAKKKPPSTTTTTIPIPKAPFTGLPDPTHAAQTRSSLAVKIENTPEARPQTGLDTADVVYEEVVDGGITRFWAVFNSTVPETVGPIRSVRAMDPGILSVLHGVAAFSGGTEGNVALVRAVPGLVTVDENNAADAFFREPTRQSPHNLYGRPPLLFQRGGQPVPPTPLFTYVPEGGTFAGAESVASFHANYDQGYDVTYAWDAAAGGWKRFQRTSEPFMAAGIPEVQVAPTNVIVQFVPYAGAGEGELFGSGEAWVFSNGLLTRGTWSHVYPEVATTFADAAGQPVALTPGRTWVELFPTGRTVDLVAGPPLAPTTTTSTTLAKKGDKNSGKKP
jgi:Protein of unknown function (DUF3048) N-terminal domain/Protein of unknown function (DUF3048) C-terminal domain